MGTTSIVRIVAKSTHDVGNVSLYEAPKLLGCRVSVLKQYESITMQEMETEMHRIMARYGM